MAIVITGGSEGTPMTWAAWHDIDPTNITEVVEGAVYIITDDVEFGDGSTPTYFASLSEMVYFEDGKIPVIKNNATFKMGELSGNYGINGSYLSVAPSGTYDIIPIGGTGSFLCYASQFHIRSSQQIHFEDGTLIDIRNSILSSTGSTAGSFVFKSPIDSLIFDSVYFNNTQVLQFRLTADTFNNVRIHKSYQGIYVFGASAVVSGMNFSDISSVEIQIDGAGANITLIDTISSLSTPIILNADGWVKEQYTFNLHVKDKDGVNLQSVTCLLEDQTDTQVFSVQTAADGTITEQTVDYKKWTGTSETLTEYSPHKFTLSKANYETLVIDEITMDELKDLQFELLPAHTDPAESNVIYGIQYGADGTEFTGTFTCSIEGLASISGVTILLGAAAKIASLFSKNSNLGDTLLEGASKITTGLSGGSPI